ncbi:hypothetical protein C8R43DRAFT_964785 [Mycena crocata]|nr:hypothetical protein C8R43DRAFT_964785 [Mycena crocata]
MPDVMLMPTIRCALCAVRTMLKHNPTQPVLSKPVHQDRRAFSILYPGFNYAEAIIEEEEDEDNLGLSQAGVDVKDYRPVGPETLMSGMEGETTWNPKDDGALPAYDTGKARDGGRMKDTNDSSTQPHVIETDLSFDSMDPDCTHRTGADLLHENQHVNSGSLDWSTQSPAILYKMNSDSKRLLILNCAQEADKTFASAEDLAEEHDIEDNLVPGQYYYHNTHLVGPTKQQPAFTRIRELALSSEMADLGITAKEH